MKNIFCCHLLLMLVVGLVACAEPTTYAPVADIGQIDSIPQSGVHVVRRGETLYEIAWRYGLDYRGLAKNNHLTSPYLLYVNQRLYLRRPAPSVAIKRSSPPLQMLPAPQQLAVTPVSSGFVASWQWPVKGKLVKRFSVFNKGINIAGYLGQPIYAAGAGRVVYAGDGLRAYGNLIILKHDNHYLSAYAYNDKNLVKEGQWVERGQKIAEMGAVSMHSYLLHFEIRREGKPFDPLTVLPR